MIKELKKLLKEALLELQKKEKWADFAIPEIEIENVKQEQFGDYATNVAMVLAGKIKKNPMEIAEKIIETLKSQKIDQIEKIEVAAPGYINFFLSQKYFEELIEKIDKQGNRFGDSQIGSGIEVNNEFISANPTGPLHLGNGRGGFYGDCLSNVLRKSGFDVVSEYYKNDAGEQVINKLAHSILKDSEAVYEGDYLEEVGNKIDKNQGLPLIGSSASDIIFEDYIQKTIFDKMHIKFDKWISEKKDLIDKGYVEKAIKILEDKKLTFEQDGALWLKTTQFGDDKDRVLIKKDGNKTYFASDCGYLLYKIESGFNIIIEIWGADHHGYIKRFESAAKALGFQGELKFIIVQLVRLMKDGKEARMSKRAGNVVYIDELIEKVSHDVTRFFFLMYSPDSHMNFDLGLAQEKSQKNPVYYVQYAHARICSILEKAQNSKGKANLELLNHEKELSLMRELNKFPELVEEIALSYEVHKLPYYAISLADKFHSFYNACRVIDEENENLSKTRLSLVKATKIVLGETLRLIGVSAPEKM